MAKYTPPSFCGTEIKNVLADILVKQSANSTALSANSWSIQTFSKKVDAQSIFIAYKGQNQDGHIYLKDVSKSKPLLVILEDPSYLEILSEQAYFLVTDARCAWSKLESYFHRHPERDLKLIAVTGTNGKSSSVWFIRELFRLSGQKCAGIGTLGIYLENERVASKHTTPDPDVLFALFRRLKEEKYDFVAMEVSSQSLSHHKIADIFFDLAIFTSFSRDHLDFHLDMDAYFAAKSLLFTSHLKKNATCLFSTSLTKFPPHIQENSIFYGFLPRETSIELRDYEACPEGSSFTLSSQDYSHHIQSPFFGKHNAENLCAALLCYKIVCNYKEISFLNMIKKMLPVPGRMQKISVPECSNAPSVFVDYAHTEDALRNALKTLREFALGPIVVVFGCGGERDRGKRPLMAACAEELADEIIVTTDNPRMEEQEAISKDIIGGFSSNLIYIYEPDRKTAISKAVLGKSAKHVILIAGKGHEKEQLIKGQSLPFDDCFEAELAIKKGYYYGS